MTAESKDISEILTDAGTFIDRTYIGSLSNAGCRVIQAEAARLSDIRMVQLKKIVYNSENKHTGLMSVYHAMSLISDALFLMICGEETHVNIYIGLRSKHNASLAESTMTAGFRGNFPGTEFETLDAVMCRQVLASAGKSVKAAAAVSQIPAEKTEQTDIQGIEHFIDAMQGKTYTALIMCTPLSSDVIQKRRSILENLYSSLSGWKEISCQYSETESTAFQETVTRSITAGITDSIQDGYNYALIHNSGTSKGTSPQLHTQHHGFGLGYGLQQGTFTNTGTQNGTSHQTGRSFQSTHQQGNSSGYTASEGNGRSMTFTMQNKTVSELMKRIDEQLERMRECEAYGLYEGCAFFLSSQPDTALTAADIYKALICGMRSSVENAYINIWTDPDDVKTLVHSLTNIRMPEFQTAKGRRCSAAVAVSGKELPFMMGMPGKSAAGIAVQQKASFGRNTVSHNRQYQRGIRIGRIYHMGCVENTPVTLNVDDFTSHVLVSGTTGAGKSTLMAMLLSALHDIGIPFFVVEPVKGEYKHLLGKVPDLQVFTVNPCHNRMLHMNPFVFHDGIHVLAHVDRLMEVFSVCWPLYAAQPALLRECIEEAYIRSGWDLNNSVYIGKGMTKYPDFRLLLRIIPEMVEKSHFTGESRGTYEGALLTRVSMLTNGIYGQVFNSSVNISDEELFDHPAIVDLSEAGSQETIALLMGILVIRLREYRMIQGNPDQKMLKHVFVMEEAHHIFRKHTSQNAEGGENIAGKSVRMLAECVAEMRGYGEGIFIVDQSPGEIDISGIRNTSTKIIMRQPEALDQRTIADSLGLNEEQIRELSRLEERTAVVYQKGWNEPVLVKINESKEKYRTGYQETVTYEDIRQVRGFYVKLLLEMERKHTYDMQILSDSMKEIGNFSEGKKKDFIALFQTYRDIYRYDGNMLKDTRQRISFYSHLLTELTACDDFFRLCTMPVPLPDAKAPLSEDPVFIQDCISWQKDARDVLEHYVCGLNTEEKDRLLRLLLLNDLTKHRQISVHNAIYGKLEV